MAYSQIQIVSPFEAEEGAEVLFQVGVKNISSSTRQFHIEIGAPDAAIIILDHEVTLGAGATFPYSDTFIMPDKNAEIFVWVEWRSGSEWIYDNTYMKTIILIQPLVPQYRNLSATIR